MINREHCVNMPGWNGNNDLEVEPEPLKMEEDRQKKLEGLLRKARQRIQEQTAEIARLQEQLQSQGPTGGDPERIARLEETCVKARTRLKQLVGRLERREGELEQAQTRIKKLEASRDEGKRAPEDQDLARQLALAQARIKKLEASRARVNKLEEQNAELARQLAGVRTRKQEASSGEEQLSATRARLEELEAQAQELAEARARIEELEAQTGGEILESWEGTDSLGDLAQALDELASARARIEELESVPREDGDLGQMQQQLARARVRIEALEAREQDLADVCQDLVEARKRIAELESQLDLDLTRELANARTRILELEGQSDLELARELASARTRLAELEGQGPQGSEIQALEQLISWRDSEIAELKTELERARIEVPLPAGSPESARLHELLGQLEAARQAASDNRAALETATVRAAANEHELRNKLTQLQTESRARLEKEMEQNDLCVARLEQEIKERDRRLAELERKLANPTT
ncbi:hypothetical protein DYH09_08645 [bacterium CPR1]|nr:hypothetical protein [bacterium CPR1]